MINLDHCILLGTLIKIHGVRGQLVLRLEHLDFDNIKEMGSVFILIDNLPVPFFISNFQPKGKKEIILTVDDTETAESAQKLLDCELYIHKDCIHVESDIQSLSESELLTGYRVIDIQMGEIGIISSVLGYKQNPLLQIMAGKKEILIPFREEFIRGVDQDSKILHVETPQGLLNL